MIRLFNANRAEVLILLPFLVGLIQYLNWISGPSHEFANAFGYWGTLDFSVIYSYIFCNATLVLNAVLLNYLFNSHQFLDKNSYLPSLLYVVSMSFYDAIYIFDYLLIVHFLLILMIIQLFELKNQTEVLQHVFNAFLFLGLATTFQPIILFFYPFFYISLYIFRPFTVREFLLSIFGFIIPFLYCFTYLWWFNLPKSLELNLPNLNYDIEGFLITFLLYVALIFFSYLSLRSKMQKSSIKLKKQIQILWLFVLMGILIGILQLMLIDKVQDMSIAILYLTILLTFNFLHKTYGLISAGIFYLCLAYTMLKYFI